MNKILYIDSGISHPSLLADTIDSLAGANLQFLGVVADRDFYRRWQKDRWRLLPLQNLLGWNGGSQLKKLIRKETITKILLIDNQDKLKLTRVALKLGLAVIWVELPSANKALPAKVQAKLKDLSALVTTVCLSSGVQAACLAQGWPATNVHLLPCGIQVPQARQGAEPFFPWKNRPSAQKPALTIGTVVDLSEAQKIEELFRLVKSTAELSLMIQLVVIGEGGERGKLAWLAKKMDIENQVWLVGERSRLHNWFPFFDLLIIASRQPNSEDLRVAEGALACGVPILAPASEAVSDCLLPDITGCYLDLANTDEAAALLKFLYQDEHKLTKLSRGAKEQAEHFYNFQECLTAWHNLLTI
jgi:hypothetical protein